MQFCYVTCYFCSEIFKIYFSHYYSWKSLLYHIWLYSEVSARRIFDKSHILIFSILTTFGQRVIVLVQILSVDDTPATRLFRCIVYHIWTTTSLAHAFLSFCDKEIRPKTYIMSRHNNTTSLGSMCIVYSFCCHSKIYKLTRFHHLFDLSI